MKHRDLFHPNMDITRVNANCFLVDDKLGELYFYQLEDDCQNSS